MAFVKLDTGILRSTLWMERDQCDVFITALLLAEPQVFDEAQAQIEVDSLKPTGFVAPPGWYGFCRAAGDGIIKASHTEFEPGMEALRALGNPDFRSRSNSFEGRRMIRVDGGYLIMNYMAYREKDHTTAERSRRYRERKRETITPSRHDVTPLRHAVTPLHRDSDTNNVTVTRDITQAEAEAEETKARRRKKQALLGQADLSAAAGETDPKTGTIFQAGLSEGQYAWRVLEAASIPSGAPLLRRAAGNAIAMLARKLECPMPRAAVEMLAVVREAQVEGVLKWLEWFQNGGWMPFVLQAEGEP